MTAAVVPPAILIALLLRFDIFFELKMRSYAITLIWGAAIAVVVVLAFEEALLLLLDGSITAQQIRSLFAAPILEELIKASILFYLIKPKRFIRLMDGFYFGAMTGAAFAMTENFFYFASAPAVTDWLYLIYYRILFTALMHVVTTSLVGAFIAAGRISSRKNILYLLGFTAAPLMHICWNYLITLSDLFYPISVGWFLFLLVSLIVVYYFLRNKEFVLLKNQLSKNSVDEAIKESYAFSLTNNSSGKQPPAGKKELVYEALVFRYAYVMELQKIQQHSRTGNDYTELINHYRNSIRKSFDVSEEK